MSTSAQNHHHQSLKKSIDPLTHSTFFNKCRNRTFFAWKVNRRSAISSHHIAATAGSLARRSKSQIFDSLFYAEKGPFSCMCRKKFFVFYNIAKNCLFCLYLSVFNHSFRFNLLEIILLKNVYLEKVLFNEIYNIFMKYFCIMSHTVK